MQSTNTAINFLSVFIILALFQDKFDPKGNIKPNKIIKGVKATLKNGGPTESFLSKNNSATKGHIVPIKITKAETANSKLFEINAVSLLTNEKRPCDSIAPDLKLKSISAPPIKTPKIISIKNKNFTSITSNTKTTRNLPKESKVLDVYSKGKVIILDPKIC